MSARPVRLVATGALIAALTATADGLAKAQGLEDLHAVVPALMESHQVPGVVLVVVRDGRVDLSAGFGLADVDAGLPMDPDLTVLRLASVAKLFVAAAAVALAEQDALNLQADVRRYVPDVPISDSYSQPITLHHLLTHTAGFEERLIGYAAPSRQAIQPLGEHLATNLPKRVRPPGLVTGYSNYGMALAAYAVERVTGVSFDEYARRSLFEPLGMRSTNYLDPWDPSAPRAVGHDCNAEGCRSVPEVYSHPYPVGLAYTTAADIGRFILAQLGHEDAERPDSPLSPSVLHRLQAEQFTHDTSLPGMSYGFFNQTVRGHRALSHAGSASGMDHLLMILPDEGIGIYFAANGGRSRFGEALRDSVLAQVLPQVTTGPRAPPVPLSASDLAALAGPYQLTRHARSTIERFPFIFATTVYVRVEDGRLRIPNPDGDRVFEPVDSLHFREVDGDGRLAFGRDAQGRLTHLFAGVPFFGSEMPGAHERRRWYESPGFLNEYASWLVAGPLILLLLVWPGAAALGWWWRRRGPGPTRLGGPTRARFLAFATALDFYLLFAVFMFAFVARSVRMFERSTGIVQGMTMDMRLLAIIPWVLAPGALVLMGLCLLVWQRSYWPWFRRVLYTGLALTGVLVVDFLVRWNYLPPTW